MRSCATRRWLWTTAFCRGVSPNSNADFPVLCYRKHNGEQQEEGDGGDASCRVERDLHKQHGLDKQRNVMGSAACQTHTPGYEQCDQIQNHQWQHRKCTTPLSTPPLPISIPHPTCTCTTTAKTGYMAPFRGWASRRQQDWWSCWQHGHQSHLPSCMALSLLRITHVWDCKTHRWVRRGTSLSDCIRIFVVYSWL